MDALEIRRLKTVGIDDNQPPHPSTGQDFYGRGPRPTSTYYADGRLPQSVCRVVAKRGSKSSYRLKITGIEPVLTVDMNRLAV